MTILEFLVTVIGVALLMGAIVHTLGSRKNKEPTQLGVGRKIRP
jgi:hypothetical protein